MSSNTDSKNQLTGGLSTKDAIHRLYKDIEDYLDDLELLLKDIQSWKYILRQAYSSKSVYSTFRWTSVVFLLISTVTYLFASKYGHFTSSVPLTIESIILILVLIMNTSIIYWNTRSRHLEMFNKARLLAAKIKECYNSEEIIQQWMSGNFYPQLNTPTSPCITLQWTYRDGRLVNLPTTLLVSGDVVLLNPGRQVPANCRRIEKVIKKEKTLSDFNFDAVKGDQLNDDLYHPYEYIFYGNDSMKDCTLMRGDTFVPKVDNVPEIFNVPRLRKAVKPCMFLVVETPYISDMKIALSNYSNRRSATAFEKELRLIFVRYLELILVPFICTLVFIFSIIHYCYIEFTGTHFDTGPATIVLIFLRPIMAILPLLPLALPVLWLVLNVYGLIKIYTSYEIVSENETAFKTISNSRTSSKSNFRKSNYYSSSEDIDNNVLNWPNSAEQGNIKQKEFFLEEMDPEKLNFAAYNQRMTLRRIFTEFYRFLSNANGILWRTANLLHVLGSITALSCADKKGIISWPNPTADKVFFLTAPGENRRKSHHSNQTPMDESSFDENADKEYLAQGEVDKRNSVLSCSTRAECVQLDITHDRHIAYGLQFDDVNWNRYMSNLKPLGLAILLNTCNQATQEEFVQFSDHIACESLHNDVAVPVVNKRCLCELARQIGFKENAIRGYEYRYQVALFRHIRADLIQKGKLAKSLNFPRLKMPFPNMTCAVIKDVFSNTSQLFSQGTGDLILDACAEYWNGESLVVLNDHERKKILDFYQRSSLTSYCCAFSYLPLINESGGIQNPSSSVSNYLNDYYIELPPDSSHLFPSQRSLDASLRGLAIDSHYFYTTSHNQNESYSNSKSIGRHLSSDSLRKLDSSNSGDTNELCGDKPNQANKLSENKKERTKSFNSDSQNLEQTMKKVVNEVFIGMATLQYQACSDFVRLIELLEAACIRFVHFSKENELRSRVFSEKMGLESGWNCHISLLNDIEPTNSNEDLLNENCDIKKFKSNLNDNSTQVKFNKSSYRNSLSSLSSTGSLLENKDNDTDNEDWDERIESFPGKEENVKFHRRRKHNSFSVSSDRSESTASNLRYNRPREFRSSSKISGHSNVQRNMSPSPSRLTTASTMTEHSAPIGFDMSNRAKLPKGIDNIRPHLENVDNVPLLVSLFTDCTSEATKEMIKIMQEYEEVVCVIGSMANDSNIAIFLQADASIGIEPMYPHYCITEPVCPSDYLPSLDLPPNFISPTDLANQLISLPCSLTMPRQNSIIFYQLIMNSRDYMMRMRNIFQFYLSSCLSLSLAQMITSLLFLPPLLSPGIVIWLSLIVIPLLSVSLMGTQRDQNVMNVATGKKLHLNKETIVYFFIGYIIKFIPSIIISVILFAIIIGMSCGQTNVGRATLGPCWMFSDVKANGDIKTDLIWSSYLLIGQTIASFFFVLYLIIISIGFVHRNHLLWQRSPLTNICWLSTSILLLIMHIGVCIIEIYIYVPEAEITKHFIEIIPFYIWIIGFLWPILLITTNVFTKRHEISMYSRQQRRARLEFGTKLGMNSPF